MRTHKIAVIGAGSAVFGLGTLATLVRSPALRGSTLTLVDIDAEGLNVMTALARRMNREWAAGMTIESSTRRAEALPDADFVILSIEVGAREELWRLDWEIPTRHGLRQPYGENGGPGGFAHTARNVPVVLGVARDMERLCPQAWLINFSNPLARLCLAVSRYTSIKVTGLCHQINVAYGIVAAVLADRWGLEVPPGLTMHSDPANIPTLHRMADQGRAVVNVKVAGLNHFIWMVDIRDRATGEDLYPLFRQRYLESFRPDFEPLTRELFGLFGLCPAPGDTHLAEYLPWCHDPLAKPWQTYRLPLYAWGDNEARRENQHRRAAALAAGEMPIESLRQARSEGAVELIEAMIGDANAYAEAVNLPNRGYIPNLPEGVIVEVPAVASGDGLRGLVMDPLPEPIAELCRRETAVASLVVDATVRGDRDLALQALLLDPTMNDVGRARAILADYLEAYAEWLPQFAKTQ